jgi:hypothetical protein
MEHCRRNTLNVLILLATVVFLVSICATGIEFYDRSFLQYETVKVSIEVSETLQGCIAKLKMRDGTTEIPIDCEYKEAMAQVTTIQRARTRWHKGWDIKIVLPDYSNNSKLAQKGPGFFRSPFFFIIYLMNYFSATFPPASSIDFFKASASSFFMFSTKTIGAASTLSLASFKPSAKTSFTIFIIAIF